MPGISRSPFSPLRRSSFEESRQGLLTIGIGRETKTRPSPVATNTGNEVIEGCFRGVEGRSLWLCCIYRK